MPKHSGKSFVPKKFVEDSTDYGLPTHDQWLVRIQPFGGESLASWLTRQAQGLGCEIVDMIRYLSPFAERKEISLCRDIDVTAGPLLLAKLARYSGLYPTRLASLPAGMAFGNEREPRRLIKHWLRHNYDGEEHYPCTQLCPQCLTTPPIPYLRRDWRFAWNLTCPIHQCALLEACPTCGKAFPVQLRMIPLLLELRCPACHADLRQTDQPVGPVMETMPLQHTITEAIRCGYWQPKRGQISTALGLLILTDALFPLLVAKSFGKHDRFFEITNRAPLLSPNRHTRKAASADWSFRHDILCMVSRLLEHWPMQLMNIACKYEFPPPWDPLMVLNLSDFYSRHTVKVQRLYLENLFRHLDQPLTFRRGQPQRRPTKKAKSLRFRGNEWLRHLLLGIRD